MRIELGKYTYLFDEFTGKSEALRNNLPWKDTCGDNLLLAMAMKIEELEAESIDQEETIQMLMNDLYDGKC